MGHKLVTAFEAADAAKEQDLRGYYPLAARLLAEEVRRLRTEVDRYSKKYFDAKSAVRCAQNWILGGDESGRGEVLELLGTESGLGPNV